MKNNFDFSGYATKNNVKCTDGRTILKDAFIENDGMTVPLVWHHMHNEPGNILGHALLENREDGVYVYGKFNDTQSGKDAKQLVGHGDITFLSIYANQLVEKAKRVEHGAIREVSLVLAGANPGAVIDNLNFAHADGTVEGVIEDEAIIYTDTAFSLPTEEVIEHVDEPKSEDTETVEDVFNTLNDKQKNVVFAIIGEALDTENSEEDTSEMKQSDESEGEGLVMKNNVFDKETNPSSKNSLTHDQLVTILADGQRLGSLKEAFLAHAVEYGIENIDYLFPDAKTLTNAPDFVGRRTEWVGTFLSGTKHTPFSRIKTMSADITLDTARAKGYIKGTLKKEEFFALARRTTTPCTIYKKQKLDRDDIIDIVDLNVVAWMKGEMRVMLDEEVARAGLVGDGREPEDPDKISETNIRPIWKDADFYAHKVQIEPKTATIEEQIEAVIRARKYYKGSGNPTMFTNTDFVTEALLIKATDGRRLYGTQAELEATLRVSKIVEVEVMDGLTRQTGEGPTLKTWALQAIIVNLNDYTYGADKGGAVTMFDDFDIDYNQEKYLIETRLSGCLTKPKCALVVEIVIDNPPG